MDADPRRPAPHLGARVTALGIAQVVSWGTLFYAIAVLGATMRADLGVSDTLLFGAYSAGLFVSGALSPVVGRWIDRGHARLALAAGSCVAAVALVLLAAAQGPASLVAGFIVSGAAMALTLYDPAFATLHVISGTSYRRAVTALTLFGGFASTVFGRSLAHSRRSSAFGVFASLPVLRAAGALRDSAGHRSQSNQRRPAHRPLAAAPAGDVFGSRRRSPAAAFIAAALSLRSAY